MSDLTFLSAVSMALQIRQKKISPLEIIEAHLAQIERLNCSLNAFVHLDADRALRNARAAEAAVMSGKTLRPLRGVPVSIKSSINVAGLRCEAGTRLRAGFVATEDAPLDWSGRSELGNPRRFDDVSHSMFVLFRRRDPLAKFIFTVLLETCSG
jgi:Asp-tRNA(Asn)/Glu-tRNA(Gln) amidotransferase A subunit family amidase